MYWNTKIICQNQAEIFLYHYEYQYIVITRSITLQIFQLFYRFMHFRKIRYMYTLFIFLHTSTLNIVGSAVRSLIFNARRKTQHYLCVPEDIFYSLNLKYTDKIASICWLPTPIWYRSHYSCYALSSDFNEVVLQAIKAHPQYKDRLSHVFPSIHPFDVVTFTERQGRAVILSTTVNGTKVLYCSLV